MVTDNNASETLSKDLHSTPGSKKDPLVRRHELLVDSGFAEVSETLNLGLYFIPSSVHFAEDKSWLSF